jgi:GxxExxY protein
VLQHDLTERISGSAIEVHRVLGPGLLESVYEACLCQELEHAGIGFWCQVPIPVTHKSTLIPLGFRADIVVADAVILEIKAVAALVPAHDTQLLSYSSASACRGTSMPAA